MSGPKLSEYELAEIRRQAEIKLIEEARLAAEEERRRQEEARKERMRLELMQVIGEKVENVKRLRSQIGEIEDYYETAGRIGDISEVVTLVNSLLEVADKALDLKKDYAATLDSASKSAETLNKVEEKLKSELDNIIKIREDWINKNTEAIRAEIGDLFKKDHSKKQTEITEPQKLTEDDNKEKVFVEEGLEYLEQITSEWENEAAIMAEAEGIKKVLENLSSLGDYRGAADYYRKKEKGLNNAIKELEAKRQQLEDEFEKAKISYEAMCEIANVMPMNLESLTASEETIRSLTEERIKVEADFLALREKQIIKEELDAVMDELGYDVIATKETTKKSGKVVNEKVFAYDEGCAINFIEANGQLTMEVVGVDTSTREPSYEESVYLESEMESFCSLHKEIEEKLKQRGVVVKHRIQINPPSREYAQILNISEYEQKKEHVSMIQGIQRSKKKQTSATSYQTMN